MFFVLLFSIAAACSTSMSTSTRDVTNLSTISFESEGLLSVAIEESDGPIAFLSYSFYGRDSAASIFSESSDSTSWSMVFSASQPTDPPSSANSMIFFSGADSVAPYVLAPVASLIASASAQCSETVSLTIALPVGWIKQSESAKSVTLVYTGPHAYGYDLALTFPNETVSSWTVHDENALLTALADAYGNDSSISFLINTHEDVNGVLVITVTVLGFPTLSAATSSYEAVSASGLDLTSEEYDFRGASSSASAPALACNIGYSAGTDDVCSDTDGCIDNTCGDGDCVDAVAPAVGYSCDCDVGWYDNSGTCTDDDACRENTCGDNGACVDVIAPGTGFTCDCDAGYVSTDLVCVNEPGCDGDTTGSCAATDSSGTCTDIAPPGTGYTCTCSAGFYVDSQTCTYRDCGAPTASTGYSIASGTTYYGSSRTLTCATGYTGSPSALQCQSSGSWTGQSGCTIQSCPSSPTQTGYSIASGTSTYGSSRTATCASGYTGTASSISCQSSLSWTTSTGCTIRNCGTPVASTGYALGSGSTTYGSTYSMSCATGYTGTAATLTCQSDGTWSAQSGCTIVSCGNPSSTTGYTINTGASTYLSTRTCTCATGYTGTAAVLTCQASGAWTAPSGCTIVSCSSSPTQTGYTIAGGASTYGSTRTTTCASPYTGSASSITCQSNGTWSTASSCQAPSCVGMKALGYGSGTYSITVTGYPSVSVYCDMSASGQGAYTFYLCSGCANTCRRTDGNGCTQYGMNILVPRSQFHNQRWYAWAQTRGDIEDIMNPPGVVRAADGCGTCTGVAMNYDAIVAAGGDWRGIDYWSGGSGRFWLRGSTYSEPNGDYNANCWLYSYWINSNAQDQGFNDGSCSYCSTTYTCSTNDVST